MAQQLINIGTLANDRTGDNLREAIVKINDNTTELYGNPLDNVININSLADLIAISAPDGGGYIELGGGIAVYKFSGLTLDISPYTLRITGGVVVLMGANRYTSGLLSTSTNPLITIINAVYADEFMNFTNVNGDIYTVDNSGLAPSAFVSQNVVIRDCKSVGTISNTNTVSLRTLSVVSTSVGGLLIEGTGLSNFNISNMLAVSWTGTLIDLGTSTWAIINFAVGSRWISPAGTTILSGAAGSANLTASGIGLVEGNIFNGDGTPVSGITTQDLKWEFTDNLFTDNVTQNTKVDADPYLIVNRSVPNAGSGVYTPIAGSDWLADLTNRWTVSTAGIATYIGISPTNIEVIAAATVEKGGGGSALICSRIAVDTGSGFTTIPKTIGCTQNSTPTQINSSGLLTVNNGDELQLWVSIDDGSSTVEVSNARLVITEH
jgi:hypothetical protein